MDQQHHTAVSKEQDIHAAERIYQEWDDALGAKDVEAAISLVRRRLPTRIAARSPSAQV